MLGDGWVMLGFGQATAKLAARHRGSAVLGIAALPAKHFAGVDYHNKRIKESMKLSE
jgi:hypothetical protein